MQIVVNGAPVTCPEQATLLDLARQLAFAPDRVVAELNREIVPSALFGETRLSEGDTLELLQFVGGG